MFTDTSTRIVVLTRLRFISSVSALKYLVTVVNYVTKQVSIPIKRISLEGNLRSICVQQAFTVTASVAITSVLLSSSTKELFTDSMTLLVKREKLDFMPYWHQVTGFYIAINWPITAELLYKALYVCAGCVPLLFKQLFPCYPAWPLVHTYSVALLLLGWTPPPTHTHTPKALESLLHRVLPPYTEES